MRKRSPTKSNQVQLGFRLCLLALIFAPLAVQGAKVHVYKRRRFILQSKKTDGYWGKWGSMAICPTDQFVYGYSLKSEAYQRRRDDTALNDIELFCATKNNGKGYTRIYSSYGPWGKHSDRTYCSGVSNPVVGFQMQIEKPQGRRGDDTAANNVHLYCKNGGRISAEVKTNWGTWRPTLRCPEGQAVTGLQTRVEAKHWGDNTALNGLRLLCDDYAFMN